MNWRRMLAILAVIALALLIITCGENPASSDEEQDNGGSNGNGDGSDDSSDVIEGPIYAIPAYGVFTETPCFVNVMFPVVDDTGSGVSDFTLADFEVLEDEQPVSPSESALHLRRPDAVPYRLMTVLALDNSLSVDSELDRIKQAANGLVAEMLPGQQMAVIQFSEEVTLLQEFTTDQGLLTAAIESIDTGFGGTNLYGAVIAGLGLWEEDYNVNEITTGFLIALTDGRDTAGRRTLSEALYTRGDKRVFTVGLSDELNTSALNSLGNAGYFHIDNAGQLADQFDLIQDEIEQHTSSFYWINYMSPKRGQFSHTLQVSIVDNENPDLNRQIIASFSSEGFYGMPRGLYVNASTEQPEGLDTVIVAPEDSLSLIAESYLVNQAPEYSWTVSDTELIELEVDPVWSDCCRVVVTMEGEGDILVRDEVNDLERNLHLRALDGPSSVTIGHNRRPLEAFLTPAGR